MFLFSGRYIIGAGHSYFMKECLREVTEPLLVSFGLWSGLALIEVQSRNISKKLRERHSCNEPLKLKGQCREGGGSSLFCLVDESKSFPIGTDLGALCKHTNPWRFAQKPGKAAGSFMEGQESWGAER